MVISSSMKYPKPELMRRNLHFKSILASFPTHSSNAGKGWSNLSHAVTSARYVEAWRFQSSSSHLDTWLKSLNRKSRKQTYDNIACPMSPCALDTCRWKCWHWNSTSHYQDIDNSEQIGKNFLGRQQRSFTLQNKVDWLHYSAYDGGLWGLMVVQWL